MQQFERLTKNTIHWSSDLMGDSSKELQKVIIWLGPHVHDKSKLNSVIK